MRSEAWSFSSGSAIAREAAFLPDRFIEELAGLPPTELSTRLARTWFGPAEPLDQIDRLIKDRREREFEYFEKISPDSAPIDMVRVGFSADLLRTGLSQIPDSADAQELARGLSDLTLRSGRFYESFQRELSPPLPSPEPSARLAASLLIDSAELSITACIADASGDSLLSNWAAAKTSAMAGKLCIRAVRLGVPKEFLLSFFFRGRLLAEAARDLAGDYREPAALRLYPHGCEPGREDAFLLEAAGPSKGQPFSAAVVLRYLLGYLEQERRIRRAVYRALGKLLAQEAA